MTREERDRGELRAAAPVVAPRQAVAYGHEDHGEHDTETDADDADAERATDLLHTPAEHLVVGPGLARALERDGVVDRALPEQREKEATGNTTREAGDGPEAKISSHRNSNPDMA